MVNYENSKIYKIVCNVTGLCYIGSTCEPTLARRLAKHVGSYKGYKKGNYHYVTSFKVLENDDYDIILLENVKNCTSKEQLYARERFFIENNDCVNRYIVGRSKQETKNAYKTKNRDKVREYNKGYNKCYYERNKDKLRERERIRNNEKHLCPCGSHYTANHRARHMKTTKHKEYVRLETLKECLTKNLSFSEIKKIMEAL